MQRVINVVLAIAAILLAVGLMIADAKLNAISELNASERVQVAQLHSQVTSLYKVTRHMPNLISCADLGQAVSQLWYDIGIQVQPGETPADIYRNDWPSWAPNHCY